MRFFNLANSRWFYIGVPVLCTLFGLLAAASSFIAGAVNNTYHPVFPTQNLLLGMKIYVGLACAGVVSLISIAIIKFGFRSTRRASILAVTLGLWMLGAIWLVLTSVPSDDTYQRTFEGHRFVIPWSRVTGEMTSRGNPLRRWDTVKVIGFRYCAKPFDAAEGRSACDRVGSFLAGTKNLTGNGYLSNNWRDVDGRNLRMHLEKQHLEREMPNAPTLSTSSSSSTSTGSSSTSGGSSDKPWEIIDAIKQADIGGMIAFQAASNYPREDAIYLFSKAEPSDITVHHAECRRGIRNGRLEDPEFICTHFVREGRKAWLLDLRLAESARSLERLAQLKSQLDRYRISSSPANAKLQRP